MKKIILSLLMIFMVHSTFSQSIQLPEPDRTGGIPLMEALNLRQSTREFSDRELSLQDISDLCWAAWGFNRADKRTAPSSMDRQEMLLYVFMKEGIYLYQAEEHILELKIKGDHRKSAGMQDFVGIAPLNFVYVADLEKTGLKSPEEINTASLIPSHANSGFMAQNVYLTASSKGLGCIVRSWISAEEISSLLKLDKMKHPLYGQTIGYKK